MAEKKTPAVSPATESAADPKTRKPAAAPETPAAEPKKRKSSGAAQRRGRPPLSPEVYVELAPTSTTSPMSSSAQRPTTAPPTRWACSPARYTSSRKRALPTTSSTRSPANWTCNFSVFRVPRTARRSTNKTRKKRFCRTPAEAFCFVPGCPVISLRCPRGISAFAAGPDPGSQTHSAPWH